MPKKSGSRPTPRRGGRHLHPEEWRNNEGAEGNRKLQRPCGPPAFLQHLRTCPGPGANRIKVERRDYRDPQCGGRGQNLQSTEETETEKEPTKSGEQKNPEGSPHTKVQDGSKSNTSTGEGPLVTLPNEKSVPRNPHRKLRRPGTGPGGQRQQKRRAPPATTSKEERVLRNPDRPLGRNKTSHSLQGKQRNRGPRAKLPKEESDFRSL